MARSIRTVIALATTLALAFASAHPTTATYVNEAFGFSLEHPADWEALEGGAARNIVDLFDDTGLGFVSVSVYELEELDDVLATLDEEALLDVLLEGQAVSVEDMDVRDGAPIAIAGIDAQVRHFDGTSAHGAGAAQTGTLYVAMTNDLLVVLFMQANTTAIDTYRTVFDGIVASFALSR